MRETDVVAGVRAFHKAFGVKLGGSWSKPERRELRFNLIREEFEELRQAETADDPVATLDALVDLVYVCVGAALEYGFDFDGAFAAVQAANMAKLGPDGKPILRADGKVVKPVGWEPPNLAPFIHATEPEAVPAVLESAAMRAFTARQQAFSEALAAVGNSESISGAMKRIRQLMGVDR